MDAQGFLGDKTIPEIHAPPSPIDTLSKNQNEIKWLHGSGMKLVQR